MQDARRSAQTKFIQICRFKAMSTIRAQLFEIREKTNEQLDTLQHGMNLFHEALSGGRKAYHVTRENGDDYDIVYTRNFDYVLPAMPEAYRHLVIYWDFLTYDEEDTAHIVLDQFQNRKKVVFLETNEYTIVIGRILLRDRKDMDLYYQDGGSAFCYRPPRQQLSKYNRE